ncbi:MAG: hypothetical protein ACXAC5_02055 [Promethearchaeota archaeon]|jgi:hypothetical protein
MSKCVNQNCANDPSLSSDKVWWGCDGDLVCNQHCYYEARKQMDHFCSVILTDDAKFEKWMGISLTGDRLSDKSGPNHEPITSG